MYGRFWVSRASTPPVLEDGNILSSAFGRTWQNTVASVNDTYLFGPNLLNNLVVTFNRTNNFNFQIYPPDYSTLGINVYNDDTPQWFFNVTGYFGINSGDTNTFLRNEIQIVDTVRWTKGRHEIATGFDYSYGQGDIVNNFRANGRFTFSNAAPFSGDALVGLLSRQVLELRAGDRRVQEHPHALPGDVHPGHVPRQSSADAESGTALGSVLPLHRREQPAGLLSSGRAVAGVHERTESAPSIPAIRHVRRVATIHRGRTSARASASPTIRSATARAAFAPVTACSTTGRTRSRRTARPTRGPSARWCRSPAMRRTTSPIRTRDAPIRSPQIRSTSRPTSSSSCRTRRSVTTRTCGTAGCSRGTSRSSARSCRRT